MQATETYTSVQVEAVLAEARAYCAGFEGRAPLHTTDVICRLYSNRRALVAIIEQLRAENEEMRTCIFCREKGIHRPKQGGRCNNTMEYRCQCKDPAHD